MGVRAVASKVLGYSDRELNKIVESRDVYGRLEALEGTGFLGASTLIAGGVVGALLGAHGGEGLQAFLPMLGFIAAGATMAVGSHIRYDQLNEANSEYIDSKSRGERRGANDADKDPHQQTANAGTGATIKQVPFSP